jgi:hypothetical protein
LEASEISVASFILGPSHSRALASRNTPLRQQAGRDPKYGRSAHLFASSPSRHAAKQLQIYAALADHLAV